MCQKRDDLDKQILQYRSELSKGLVKLGNIVAETLFLVMFPWVAKLAGNKQNVLLPQWQNDQHRG